MAGPTNPVTYTGRFAPSPTGPLHAGSLVAALASWLDARAHDGKWLLRIEDVDTPRCMPGADRIIIKQLADCGLVPDEIPLYQSQRSSIYKAALDSLIAAQRAYACGCSRKDIEDAAQAAGSLRVRGGELVYPGTCRYGLGSKPARSWRFKVPESASSMAINEQIRAQAAPDSIASDQLTWTDRALGPQSQNVRRDVGDFVLKRADGLWAYQLAVVVDDAAQGITHVVRGADLLDNTARQISLQRALGTPQPRYLHTPLVLGANGEKLSKQNGAQALDLHDPVSALRQAGQHLGIVCQAATPADWLQRAAGQWAERFGAL